VMVSATIPPAGAREGQLLDCVVSSIGAAKSLAQGRLFVTPLLGPNVQTMEVYAFAEGAIHLDDLAVPTNGKVHAGCRLEREFFHEYVQDDRITLRLKTSHADFEVATEIAELINSDQRIASGRAEIAHALDQLNIQIDIPQQYLDEPAQFAAEVLKLSLPEPRIAAQVVINERAGSIIIGGDVEIGAAIVTHKNIMIETGDNLPLERFPVIDPTGTRAPRLKALVAALNAVKVPTEDIIEIIKGLDRNGKLHARLIIE